jgi:hypothetical protein
MSTLTIGQKSYSREQILANAKKASGWFAIIAFFSLVNSLLLLLQVKVTFVVGLGATQVIDALMLGAREQTSGPAVAVLMVMGLAINLMVLGAVVLIWRLSLRGSTRAYATGMALYLLDGGIFALVGDWVGVGFHVFFLFMLWGGFSFVRRQSAALEAASGADASSPALDTPQFTM